MKEGNYFFKISYYAVLLLVLVLPIFFLPHLYLTLSASKIFFLYLISIISVVGFILHIADTKKFVLIKDPIIFSLGLILSATFLSSVLNGGILHKLIGTGFQSTTFIFLFLLSLLLYVVIVTFDTFNRISLFLKILGIPFILVSLFHISRLLFGPTFLSFDLFPGNADSVIGIWSDLSIFYGFYAVLFLSLTEKFSFGIKGNSIVYISLAVSLIALVLFQSTAVWVLLLISAIVWLVFGLIFGRFHFHIDPFVTKESKKTIETSSGISPLALGMIVLSLIFVIWGPFLSTKINNHFGISFFEARPSVTTTLTVTEKNLKENILIASGPNSFGDIWNRYKPQALNQTDYYTVDFEYGFSWLLTILATIGVLGISSWLLFFICFGILSVKLLSSKIVHSPGGSASLILLFSSIFLWISTMVFVPGPTLIVFTFLVTALFLASLANLEIVEKKVIHFGILSKKVQGPLFFALMGSVLVLLYSGYLFGKQIVALGYFDKGLTYLKNDSENNAIFQFEKARALNPIDSYYRAIIEVNLSKLDVLLSIENPSDEEKKEFSRLLNNSIFAADQAISYNKENYKNWIAQARVYVRVSFLPDAQKTAQNAYNEALARYPHSPLILSEIGQFYALLGNNEKAKEYIEKSLSERPGDIQNILLFAQISSDTDPLATKKILEQLASESNNVETLIQLGALSYNQGEYAAAAVTFKKAFALEPNNFNAQYLLGISEAKRGNATTSLEILKDLELKNQNVPNLGKIISNLESGNDPFAEESKE